MNRISHLLSKCLEPIEVEPPKFSLRVSIEQDVSYIAWIMQGESAARIDHARRGLVANGLAEPNGDVMRAWSLAVVGTNQPIGIMVGVECEQSVNVLELYVARDWRRRGLGGQLLWCAEFLAGKNRNPVLVLAQRRDAYGISWLRRRQYHHALSVSGERLAGPAGDDGEPLAFLVRANDGAMPRVRIAQ